MPYIGMPSLGRFSTSKKANVMYFKGYINTWAKFKTVAKIAVILGINYMNINTKVLVHKNIHFQWFGIEIFSQNDKW